MNAGLLGDLACYLAQDRKQFYTLDTRDSSINSITVFELNSRNLFTALTVDSSQGVIHTIDNERNIQAFSPAGNKPVFQAKITVESESSLLRPSCLIAEGNIIAFTSQDAHPGHSMQPNAEDLQSFRVHMISTNYKHQFTSRINIDHHASSDHAAVVNGVPNPVVSMSFSRSYSKNFLLVATFYHRLYLLQLTSSGIQRAGSLVVSDGRHQLICQR
jgi:hypothetical protein